MSSSFPKTNDHVIKNGLGKIFSLPKALMDRSLIEVMQEIDYGDFFRLPFKLTESTIVKEKFQVIPCVLNPRGSSLLVRILGEQEEMTPLVCIDAVIGGADGLYVVEKVGEVAQAAEEARRWMRGMSSPSLVAGSFKDRSEGVKTILAAPLNAFA